MIRIYMTQWKIVIVKICQNSPTFFPRPRGHEGHGVMSAIAQRSHHFQEALLVEVSRTWQDRHLEWKIVVQCGAPIAFVVDVSTVWGYKTTNITGGDLVNRGKN